MQEWCGHVFTQLNNKDNFEIDSYSYFESEGDKSFNLDKAILENELWNKIRINPAGLPIGEINVIPSFEYLRLAHKELKSYRTTASLTKTEVISAYTIEYPELERTLTINFFHRFSTYNRELDRNNEERIWCQCKNNDLKRNKDQNVENSLLG